MSEALLALHSRFSRRTPVTQLKSRRDDRQDLGMTGGAESSGVVKRAGHTLMTEIPLHAPEGSPFEGLPSQIHSCRWLPSHTGVEGMPKTLSTGVLGAT